MGLLTKPSEMHDWLRTNAVAMVNAIAPDATPLWGSMSGRHLVEHLTGSMRMSNGRFDLKLRTPEEKLEAYRRYLLKPDSVLTPNVKVEGLQKDVEPYRDASIEISREKHEADLNSYFSFFEAQPNATPTHPVFGPLSFDDWAVFHYKHYLHHLSQFGQLPIPEHKSYDAVRG